MDNLSNGSFQFCEKKLFACLVGSTGNGFIFDRLTFNRLLTRFQIVQIVEEQLVHLRYISRSNQWSRVAYRMPVRLHFFAWMWLPEQLLRNLTEIVDEADRSILLQRVIDVVNVNIAFVKQMMEHIDRINSCIALLFTSEYQVDPLM